MRRALKRIAVVCLLFAGLAQAQDPFEIHVYEYETLRRGQFTFETHLNYVGKGTRTFNGPVAPFQDQLHMTFELTAGLTDYASLGFMQLNARRVGHALEYAGWRVLPHFYVPRSWRWPMDVGLVAEFSFQKTTYEENSRRIELRPILEKNFGRLQIDFNPVFERALHGPGTRNGWNFEPAARLGYEVSQRFTPSLEYYSASTRFFRAEMSNSRKMSCGVSDSGSERPRVAAGWFTSPDLRFRLGIDSKTAPYGHGSVTR